MKSVIIPIIIFLFLFTSLSFGSPATDYSFLREFGQSGIESNRFWQIDGVAVDRFGHVFVSDLLGKITPNGTGSVMVIKRWSTIGQYQLLWTAHNFSEMYWPAGIDCSCDGDPFYVAPFYLISPYGKVIEHTTPEGGFLEIFPGFPWQEMGFYFIDVAISANGFAYGTFRKNAAGAAFVEIPGIAKFVWDGINWVSAAQVILTNTFEISNDVHGIDVDPWRNRVYVTVLSTSNGIAAVKVYDMDLNFIQDMSFWGYDAMPYGVAVDNRDGSFFVCEAVSNIIQKFDISGAPITEWGGPGGGESEFNKPTDLDVDMNGHVYVADSGNSRIQVFAPPMEGNLNFIVLKSKVKVKWKQKAKGKDRDVVMAKGYAAVDVYTNLFGGPGSAPLINLPMSFWYGELPVISNMPPTKTNKKGTRALYKPDKNHKAKLNYREKGALIKFVAKLKRGNVNEALNITDSATLPPWLWVNAQMTLSTNYLGVHYMRLEHKNKVGKNYKAIKK